MAEAFETVDVILTAQQAQHIKIITNGFGATKFNKVMTNSLYYVSLYSTMDKYLCLSRRRPGFDSRSRRFMEVVCNTFYYAHLPWFLLKFLLFNGRERDSAVVLSLVLAPSKILFCV